MKTLNSILVALFSLNLAACGISSREEAAKAAKSELPDYPETFARAQQAIGDVPQGWIAQLGDKNLVSLVQEAQANNRDMQAASAGVERAWLLADRAGAALKPRVGIEGGSSASGNFHSKPGAAGNAQVQASWEVDLWGRIRSARQAAVVSAEAVEADYKYSQYSLAASVANAYFLAIDASLTTSNAEWYLNSLNESFRIVTLQESVGAATPQDIAMARSDISMAEAMLIQSQAGERESLRSLEVLLGRYPSAEVDIPSTFPAVPPAPPAGVPASLLERRPDLVAAERRVAAAFNLVDEAKAARLPRLSLTAAAGGASNDLSQALSPSNLAWSVGAGLVAPLYEGGALNANVEITKTEQKQAIAAYGQAALRAFREVEGGLDFNVVNIERVAKLEEGQVDSRDALKTVQLTYDEGEIPLIEVLRMERRVFLGEIGLLMARRSQLEQWIGLNMALGGSWEAEPSAPAKQE